tara:strand:+ start:25941 stop:26141 length:201 start_codon:yes stop_codon:yes gene_type:complete
MRDKAYRKQQEVKKSYKKFVTEMKQEKFKEPSKKRNNKINLDKIDYNNLSEEDISELEEMVDKEQS